ncbi:Uncharacterised protein [Yersinia nurmii]|uniref:Uncharacterized protein n=1 Tax=Yersinia nurmii TaxID=685706 RepID=A0ABP1YH25_9GAMM|nr:Uncharacterised protein [Yersinia nurmii]
MMAQPNLLDFQNKAIALSLIARYLRYQQEAIASISIAS